MFYGEGRNPHNEHLKQGLAEFIHRTPFFLQGKPKKGYNIKGIRANQSMVRLYVKSDSGKRRNFGSSPN